jgi:hypothetical protein
MKKQFETREALLQDALDYYWGKPKHQCLMKGSEMLCSYTPSETSEGCAIGRLVELDVAEKLQEINHAINEHLFGLLPEWLQAMGMNFLYALQKCHDKGFFVNKDKDRIKHRLCEYLDLSKIKFPE